MDEIERKNKLIEQNTKNLQDLNYQSQVKKLKIIIQYGLMKR